MSAADRRARLAALADGDGFDLLVIGGGATGCGIAVDAASRGLKVALVERGDFAEGTSSRSTKLLHGGVRYLEAAVRRLDRTHFKLVREALRERGALLANAPHLSDRLALVTPLYSWAEVPYVYAGLKLYDLLAGRRSIGASRFLTRGETLARFPGIEAAGLKAGVLYYDGQFVDARMVIALMRTARESGALMLNQVAAIALRHGPDGRIAGADLEDRLEGGRLSVAAKAVINAAGPFADQVAKLDDADAKPILTVSSGAHIVLDRRFVPPDTGLLVHKTEDGRVLFVLPWQDHALVGTTDETAALSDHPHPSPGEIAYLLDHARRILGAEIGLSDIKASWSGLRPLAFDPRARNSAELARDHVLIEAPSGLITITGGKWTTYRLMAEQVVGRAVALAGLAPARACVTAGLKLFGAEGYDPGGDAALARRFGLDADVARHLNRSHGGRAVELAELAAQGWGARLHPDHPFIEAEAIYAVRREDALHVADVLARRLPLALIDRAAACEAVPRVAALMAGELGWTEAETETETAMAGRRLAEGL